VAASGTLPMFREAERIDSCCYWDGLYSQNPPVREFLNGVDKNEVPDELWIVRINPQQWPEEPKSNGDIMDRENEMMGNLSLHKELDFILAVNEWRKSYGEFQKDYKHVTVRSIKMTKRTADELRYSSKFDRSREFMDRLRLEGHQVARDWLDRWPDVGCYPEDAGYSQSS
ncbi:MAG: patatin-like phospholipase family protein, partial [Bryobacteraceae bacterium]